MKDLTLAQLEEIMFGNTLDLESVLDNASLNSDEKLEQIRSRILFNYISVHNAISEKNARG